MRVPFPGISQDYKGEYRMPKTVSISLEPGQWALVYELLTAARDEADLEEEDVIRLGGVLNDMLPQMETVSDDDPEDTGD